MKKIIDTIPDDFEDYLLICLFAVSQLFVLWRIFS